jgi:hypothetical protein
VPDPEDRPDLSKFEECPHCHKQAVLSTEGERGFTFVEPVCAECKWVLCDRASMDDFDRAYERARANGWAD